MSKKPKRTAKVKEKVPEELPSRWNNEEMETLLSCVMQYSHKDLDKIQEHLPGRSVDTIKRFMRTIHDTARQRKEKNDVLDIWLNKCDTVRTPWKDCLQIAQVLKYLSVDGLLENHPLPERCQGINFSQAYRLMYEAMMGYPIQPVNKPTAEFVLESLAELRREVKKQSDAIKNVELFLQNKTKEGDPFQTTVLVKEQTNTDNSSTVKKSLRVYQRKKPPSKPEVAPSLKIIVTENQSESSGSSKDFSVTVEGKNCSQSTTVNVPMASEVTFDEDEQKLLKSSTYNPFNIPTKWLKEPLYLNLIRRS